MNKIKIILLAVILCLSTSFSAQTIISKEEGATADPSALLEMSSDSLGLLVPRLAANQRINIGSPATGLFLFQTDQTLGFMYNQGVPNNPDWVAVDLSETDTTFFEKRIPMDSIGNGEGPFVINESGSYYFTKDLVFDASGNYDGITINASYVTIDLNGFSLSSDKQFVRDGIDIADNLRFVTIKNGTIAGWSSEGISAIGADNCVFKNLKIEDCVLDGLTCGENALIKNCLSSNNGADGFQAFDGCVVVDCVSSFNGNFGFFLDDGCVIENCVASNNKDDGFDLGSHCRVEGCTGYENEKHAFDVFAYGHIYNSNAYDNGGNGFDLGASCVIINSKADFNGYCIINSNCDVQPSSQTTSGLALYGNGIRVFSNSQVINCTANENERVGIRIDGADNVVRGNSCSENDNVGIYASGTASFIFNNAGIRNGNSPNQNFQNDDGLVSGNFFFHPLCAFGPIVNVNDAGDINTVANSEHPFANIEY